MDRIISEQQVLKIIDSLKANFTCYDFVTLDEVASRVKAIPSAEPKTGHWILKIEDWNKWICSKCGHTERTDIHVSLGYDFCPKCGANMSENPTGSESEDKE